MAEEFLLEKTIRMNLLFDFYGPLLTEKQRQFLTYYFHEDYSLSEIAAEFQISRQAVYEHIKRAGQSLDDYENKLHLLHKHETRMRILNQLQKELSSLAEPNKNMMMELVEKLRMIDLTDTNPSGEQGGETSGI